MQAKMGKVIVISDNYHDIGQLLLAVKIARHRLLSNKISRLIGKTG